MPPLVYVVRHGQTDWNAEYRLQGQADTDLNATGRRQASGNGRRLASLISAPSDFDFVASPMLRTRHTMERMRAAMGLDPPAYRTDACLVEINFGDWQGFTFAELEARYPGAAGERQADKWDFVPPGAGAESYEMLLGRVAPFFKALRRDTVCVAHGGIIRVLFRLVGGLSKDDAATIDTPQDRVLRMSGGDLEWI